MESHAQSRRRRGPRSDATTRRAQRDQPGADFVCALAALSERLSQNRHPIAGSESVFVGQIHSGEIYNQYPQECWLEGTRAGCPAPTIAPSAAISGNWSPTSRRDTARGADEMALVARRVLVGHRQRASEQLQNAYAQQCGHELAYGAKPFVDDGNSFWSGARVPAITHGPRAGGQHTVNEWVSIDDLVRVAHLYALVATTYCAASVG